MNKTTKVAKVSAVSIVFYVLAVILLCVATFEIWQAYLQVQNYLTQYTLDFSNMLHIYITYCAQYFAFAFILYGIGAALGKLNAMHNALSVCIVDAVEEKSETEIKPKDAEVVDETLVDETI